MANEDNTYTGAGFNRFFKRSLGSDPSTTSLRTLPSMGNTRQLNFDDKQISGALGDIMRLGRMSLDGKIGRLSVFDERGNEVLRLGNLDEQQQ